MAPCNDLVNSKEKLDVRIAHDPALALDQDEPDHFRGRWVGAFLRTAPPAAGVHQAKSDTISLLTEPDEQEKHGRLDKQGRLNPARLDRGDFGGIRSPGRTTRSS